MKLQSSSINMFLLNDLETLMQIFTFLFFKKRLQTFGSVTKKIQGRRRLLESGTAIERFRRSPSAKGTSGGSAREGVRPSLVKGVWESHP